MDVVTPQEVETALEAMRGLFPETPLQLNDHLSARYGANIYLKREEECLAGCAGAPMMVINGHYHERLTVEKVDELLDGLE